MQAFYKENSLLQVFNPVVLTPVTIPIVQHHTVPFINFTKVRRPILPKHRPILPKPGSINNAKSKSRNVRKRNLFPTKIVVKPNITNNKLEHHFKSPIIIRKQLASNANKYLKNFKFNSSVFRKVKENKMSENIGTQTNLTMPSLSDVEKPESAALTTESNIVVVQLDEDKTQEKVSLLKYLIFINFKTERKPYVDVSFFIRYL